MLVEALILVGEQQPNKARIDVLRISRQPPAPVRRGIGAQQPPVAVEHDMRIVQGLSERRWPQGIEPRAACQRDGCSRAGQACDDAPTACHFAAWISMAPVAVRPKRSGRYMSSTIACG